MKTYQKIKSDAGLMAGIFGPQGTLAATLAGYECRQGQLAMAEAVWRVLSPDAALEAGEAPSLLAVEAGTGIGKSLAYLVPAALSGRKIVISTGTLNLQDQLVDKEIPFIVKHIDPELTALCVKGRQNYICLHRWHQLSSGRQTRMFAAAAEIEAVKEWLTQTGTGDRAELDWLPDDSLLWEKINSHTSKCLGQHCQSGGECFVNRLRKKAARARILIVNHHLFFSDLALRRFGNAEVLPRYEAVVFDEAHHLENIATRYFGTSISQYQILDLASDVESLAKGGLKEKQQEKTTQLARALATQADIFAAAFPAEPGRYSLDQITADMLEWPTVKQDLLDRLTGLAAQLEKLQVEAEIWVGMQRRCEVLIDNLHEITEEYRSSRVYWLEKRQKSVQLTASPIDIAPELQEHFFAQIASAIFTSATLTTAGNFKYFADRLGLPSETETLALQTPFDYQASTLLYVPANDFPLPSSPEFQEAVGQQTFEIIEEARGRTLILFTSVIGMKSCYSYLAGRLSYPLLMQGDAPKSVLLEEFRSTTHSVLLAVASFWEGVDVPGEALSCVIIDKLPFEVPSDPVMVARVRKIEEEGGNPFFDFQIPRAVLALRQGVGRLMRSSSDSGLIAILDVRLFTKTYGRIFLKSLPASPVCREMGAVRKFFGREAAESKPTS